MNDRKLSRGPLLLLASLVVVIDQVSKTLVASVLAFAVAIGLLCLGCSAPCPQYTAILRI